MNDQTSLIMNTRATLVVVALTLLLAACQVVAHALFIPGVHPTNYRPIDSIPIKVGRLISPKSELTYRHYDLPVCRPPAGPPSPSPANLGELLSGDMLYDSLYDVRVLQNTSCALLCTVPDIDRISQGHFGLLLRAIEGGYRGTLRADNLAAVEGALTDLTDADSFAAAPAPAALGYPLGRPLWGSADGPLHKDRGASSLMGSGINERSARAPVLHNHLLLYFEYHERKVSRWEAFLDHSLRPGQAVVRLVGLHVVPRSLRRPCDLASGPQQALGDVTFSYSAYWLPSGRAWANRWQPLMAPAPLERRTTLFATINSVLVTLLATGLLALALARALHLDLQRYRQQEDLVVLQPLSTAGGAGGGGHGPALSVADELLMSEVDSGWKMVAHDVFRAPAGFGALCVLAGSGLQVLLAGSALPLLTWLGLGGPGHRGVLTSSSLVLLALAAYPAGRAAGGLWKRYSRTGSKRIAGWMALLLPGCLLALFTALDLAAAWQGAQAVPLTSLAALAALWGGLLTPLALAGGWKAGGAPAWQPPVPTNRIPRAIPPQPWWCRHGLLLPLAGLLPFFTCFVQALYIASHSFAHQWVHMWGVVTLVAAVTAVAAAEAAILVVYLGLRHEDYRWWWPAFWAPAFSGAYLCAALLALLWGQMSSMVVSVSGAAVLVGHVVMVSLVVGLAAGGAGFWASLWFVERIYAAAKAD